MKHIAYLLLFIILLILAPLLSFFIAFITFFTSLYTMIGGFYLAYRERCSEDIVAAEEKDIWDKHIERMKNKANFN